MEAIPNSLVVGYNFLLLPTIFYSAENIILTRMHDCKLPRSSIGSNLSDKQEYTYVLLENILSISAVCGVSSRCIFLHNGLCDQKYT